MLNSNEVGPDERDMVDLAEHANDSAVVDARNHDSKEVSEEGGLLLEVERQSLVVNLDVGDAGDHILELVMLPSIGRAFDHSKSGVILDES
jgi:hypothetical protein